MKQIQLLTIGLVLLSLQSQGQSETGVVRGQMLVREEFLAGSTKLYDTTACQFAIVRIVEPKSGQQSNTITDYYGYFQFDHLPKGVYQIQFGDQALREHTIYVEVLFETNNSIKPFLIDRTDSTVKVLPKYFPVRMLVKR